MSETSTTSMLVVFARFFWMLIGPLLLVVALYQIVISDSGWRTAADIAYFVVLGCMILGRWTEFRGGDPRTSTGEPASPADLSRYIRVAAIAGILAWVLANLLGNHILAG